ncbi:putative serine/threonine-protein kinase [Sesbania bispinosa]|nr:putative serine/threonine-protein kinase [Sesbania bispinosa]
MRNTAPELKPLRSQGAELVSVASAEPYVTKMNDLLALLGQLNKGRSVQTQHSEVHSFKCKSSRIVVTPIRALCLGLCSYQVLCSGAELVSVGLIVELVTSSIEHSPSSPKPDKARLKGLQMEFLTGEFLQVTHCALDIRAVAQASEFLLGNDLYVKHCDLGIRAVAQGIRVLPQASEFSLRNNIQVCTLGIRACSGIRVLPQASEFLLGNNIQVAPWASELCSGIRVLPQASEFLLGNNIQVAPWASELFAQASEFYPRHPSSCSGITSRLHLGHLSSCSGIRVLARE